MTLTKLTKEQAIILTGYTGCTCCTFADFQKDVEKRLGRPVWTHQFADKNLWQNEIQPAYEKDFMFIVGAE